MADRLQKVLAQLGMGSRRAIEQWIKDGRIQVNGEVAQLGVSVDENDKIKVDGKPVSLARLATKRPRAILYHKPEGEICSKQDDQGRATVFDHLPNVADGRWINIGRLDVNTSGLLIFTTDGELANRLMHPSYEIEREYAVRVFGEVSDDVLKNLRQGVELDDGMASFKRIREAGGEGRNHWYHVILNEGRNREVRRLWESQEIQVSRLIRLRFGPIELGRDVRQGRWRDLSYEELRELYRIVDMQPPERPTVKRKTQTRHQKVPRKRRV